MPKDAHTIGVDYPSLVIAEDIIVPPTTTEESGDAVEHLMPYGKVAKAIFVRANGVAAYNRQIRFVRCAD